MSKIKKPLLFLLALLPIAIAGGYLTTLMSVSAMEQSLLDEAIQQVDGKIIFGVGDFKNVYKQMVANPLVEIVACKTDGHWLRYTGKAVFETDYSYAEKMIKAAGLEAIYNEETGNKLMTFHLEDATAVDIAVMGEGENLL